MEEQPSQREDAGEAGQAPRSIFDVLLGPEGGGLPWERRREFGFFRSLWMTVRGVLTSPFRTFRAMRRSGGWWEPLGFALLVSVPALVLGALLHSFVRQTTPVGTVAPWGPFLPGSEPLRTLTETGLALLLALALPLGAALGTHLCLILFRQPGAGFEPTLRVTCYALGSASLLVMVPICGSFLLVAWYLVAGTIGLVMVHRAKVLPAVGALALPPATVLMLLGIAMSILGLARIVGTPQ